MVGDYRRAQRNGRAVADAIGERKKAQRDEPRPDCLSEKQHAQRNVKHAQNPLTSVPVGRRDNSEGGMPRFYPRTAQGADQILKS